MFTSSYTQTRQRGFTLIEMMVSMALFAVVAVVAIGALLKIVDANKKAQAIETSINNLNFVLESMSREMRLGTNYSCYGSSGEIPTTLSSSRSCDAAGNWAIGFNSSKTVGGDSGCNLIYAYAFEDGVLQKAEQASCGGALTFSPVISNDTNLDSQIAFDIASARVVSSGVGEPYAQFHFRGSAGVKEKTKSTFDLQTTVSQRIPD